MIILEFRPISFGHCETRTAGLVSELHHLTRLAVALLGFTAPAATAVRRLGRGCRGRLVNRRGVDRRRGRGLLFVSGRRNAVAVQTKVLLRVGDEGSEKLGSLILKARYRHRAQ